MNDHDSQRMRSLLRAAGYDFVQEIEQANILLINSCSVRDKAAAKARSLLGRFIEQQQKANVEVIGLLGCLAAHESEQLLQRFHRLNLIVSPAQQGGIVELIERALDGERVVAVSNKSNKSSVFSKKSAKSEDKVTATVTVMRGCDNYCAYCIVPYLRGPQVSRPLTEIVDEVEELVSQGVKEVLLLGQNVNSYGQDLKEKIDFAKLLEAIDCLPGLERIRFTTSHPKDLNDSLINSFATLKKLCPQLHLPLQSASDKILKAMNRGYTAAHYLERLESLRRVRPDIALSSDIIVGYPGEEEEDFKATIHFLEKIKFSQVFSFVFSPRTGTASAKLPFSEEDQQLAKRRLIELQAWQEQLTLAYYRQYVGKSVEVLAENFNNKNGEESLSGRTLSNTIVHFNGQAKELGQIIKVKIDRALAHCLTGRSE